MISWYTIHTLFMRLNRLRMARLRYDHEGELTSGAKIGDEANNLEKDIANECEQMMIDSLPEERRTTERRKKL